MADLPALVRLFGIDGARSDVSLDSVDAYEFHRELSAHLATGAPMQVSARQSRDVVAVMEAAEESALDQGRPVVPAIRT